MNIKNLFRSENIRRIALSSGYVAPDGTRCVQCGICSYHCPLGIDVRNHAWSSRPIHDSRCLTCGECVSRCPRGVLSFQSSSIPGQGVKS